MIERDDKPGKYKEKGRFSRTVESSGGSAKSQNARIFVIQKHQASRLHYDFRLEVDGVLKSWATPKGPSTDPRERRLAIATEDHRLDYAYFEGKIPKDEYGGGSVLVWDTGHYRNMKEDDDHPISMEKCIEEGRVAVWLEGQKLRGGYALIKTRRQGKSEQWLLIKMDDEEADAQRNPLSSEPRSVLSGRTIEEIAEQD